MSWLDEAIDRWGNPSVSPPPPGTPRRRGGASPCTASGLPGVDIGRGIWRRAWVWFPPIDGRPTNHSVSIDGPVGGGVGEYRVGVGSHHGTHAEGRFDHDPTNDEVRAILWGGWSCCLRERRACPACGTIPTTEGNDNV